MLIFKLTSMWLSFSYCPVYLGAIMSNVFLPCMLGNMRFISFTFIKSSYFFLVIIDSSPRFVIKECFYLPPKDVQCSRKMCYVEHFTKWQWLNLGQVFDTLCFWCDIALKSRTTSRLSCLVLIEGNNKTFQQFLTRIAVRRQFLVVSLQLEVVRGEI